MIETAVYNILTLYMLMILLRWLGARISLDVASGRLRFISVSTDPLIAKMRQLFPSMGSFDFGPISALVMVWLIREIAGVILNPSRF